MNGATRRASGLLGTVETICCFPFVEYSSVSELDVFRQLCNSDLTSFSHHVFPAKICVIGTQYGSAISI